ncbi:hypothetical protein GOP47_0030454 [Adiantum capillus-veneris]|nr:hypothetical protein GOP47_0030454 [Adiantum capillus-veneris]
MATISAQLVMAESRPVANCVPKGNWVMRASFQGAAGIDILQLKLKINHCTGVAATVWGRHKRVQPGIISEAYKSSTKFLHAEEYQALGLKPGATQAEIKRAYRRLALRLHPDTCKEAGGGAAARFIRATNAYHALLKHVAEDRADRENGAYRYYHSRHNHNSNADIEEEEEEGYPRNLNMEDMGEWEEWMGWEGANGTYDYTAHIRQPA